MRWEDPRRRMYGDLRQLDDGRWQLRFTRTLRQPPEKVWRAITEPDHLAHWFPTTIDGERAAGAGLRFVFPADQAPPFDGEMIACEPPSLMELPGAATSCGSSFERSTTEPS